MGGNESFIDKHQDTKDRARCVWKFPKGYRIVPGPQGQLFAIDEKAGVAVSLEAISKKHTYGELKTLRGEELPS